MKFFAEEYGLTVNLNYLKRDDAYRLTTSSKNNLQKYIPCVI